MPKSNGNKNSKSVSTLTSPNKSEQEEEKQVDTEKRTKTRRRNANKKKRMSTFYHNGLKTKKKEIAYSGYIRSIQALSESAGSTESVRCKKGAKRLLERLLVIFLNNIMTECKWVCNLEELSNIREKDVITQIKQTYPPHVRDEVVDFCRGALQNYVDSLAEFPRKKKVGSVKGKDEEEEGEDDGADVDRPNWKSREKVKRSKKIQMVDPNVGRNARELMTGIFTSDSE